MKEVVSKILEAEAGARKKIEQARSDADAIIKRANDETAELLAKAEAEAKELIVEKGETTEQEFLANKEKIVKEAREKAAAQRTARLKDKNKIAQKIFSEIIAIEE